jgi:Ca-activated chloride channel family protein
MQEMTNTVNILAISDWVFRDPWIFWFLLIIPCLVVFQILMEGQKRKSATLSTVSQLSSESGSKYKLFRYLLFALKMLGIALLICALARPQNPKLAKDIKKNYVEGIDIMLALDVSGSMLDPDFYPNRMEASKEMAIRFVNRRKNDNIGLVLFGGEAFTQSPLSSDHKSLIESIEESEIGVVSQSTAIGEGLAVAGAGLFESEAKSKVVVLLTDGQNTAGEADPMETAAHLKAYNIKIYTIGMGSNRGGGLLSGLTLGSGVDEALLRDIAELSGGKYFHAQTRKGLDEIYAEIDRMEKTKLEINQLRIEPPEVFHKLLIMGFLLVLLEFILMRTWLKSALS